MEKKTFNLIITETLQRECEIEAESEQEALQILEDKWQDGELILDYSDFIDVEFSNCKYTKKEIQILKQISEYCKNECCSCDNCPEDDCVLFRIEKIIENGFYEEG